MSDTPAVKLGFAKVEHEIIDDLRKTARDATMDLISVKKDLFQAQSELSATQQKLEAAEARIKASQEQEPIGFVCNYQWGSVQFTKPQESFGNNLYGAPVIPPDVAELQRENAELTRKLAEQQAVMRLASKAFDETASEYRSGYLNGGSVETSDLRVEAWRAVANCDDAELTKLLAEAKSKTVPEGWQLVPLRPTDDMQRAGHEQTSFGQSAIPIYTAMLSAAPQPETARGSNE